MSMNTIALAEKMTGDLDKAVCQKSVTGLFADNVLRAKFVGAGKVLIPEIDMAGLGAYDRDSGFVQGAISVSNEPYELTMDRARTFQLDAQDNDESGVASLAGQVMGEFIRTKVVPELDAYCLSKLAQYAVSNSQTVALTGALDDSVYSLFTDAVAKAQNAVGYDEELVAFVDGAVYTALMKSSEIERLIEVGNFTKGGVDTVVKSLNGVTILPVTDSRMKTAYTFLDGKTSGMEAGGFAPAAGALNIGLLVLPRRAASLVKKTEAMRIFAPAQNVQADAYKFDYRLYYDLFIRKSMGGGIVAYVGAAA